MGKSAHLFAAELRARRRGLGLTQAALAETLGVSANTVARWERGELRVGNPERVRAAFGRLECDAESPSEFKPRVAPVTPLPHIARARSIEIGKSNLPVQLTTFIGRERELAEVARLLDRARLVTLTGPAGIGKTRFALELATRKSGEYPDGVRFVELGSVQESNLITQAIAAVLQVPELHGQPLIETVNQRLRTLRLLLVLDNCEHLLSACATVVEALLCASPGVRILATTRERLRIGGERVWRVAPLSLPDSFRPGSEASIEHFEAISLFVQRARGVQPGFCATRDNAPTLVDICRHLDGIPLSIELAAACADFLSPSQILARLGDRFTLLASGSRTAPPRQQSLARAIGWSCDLLTEAERTVFARSSVFAGIFTAEAAAAVCSGDAIESIETLDLIGQLVRKSLIVAEPGPSDEIHYRLLETLRAYAQQLLQKSGALGKIAQRHASFYVGLARRSLYEEAPAAWAQQMNRQYEDLEEALRWLIDSDDADGAHILGAALSQVWRQRGYISKGRTTLATLLELPGGRTPTRGRACLLLAAGYLALYQGDLPVARTLLGDCVSTLQCVGETRELPMAFGYLADIDMAHADCAAARAHLEAGLAASRRVGDNWSEATLLVRLAQVLSEQGDSNSAAALAKQALPVLQARGAKRVLAMGLQVLAEAAVGNGDYPSAKRLLEEALANWNAVRGLKGAAWTLLDCARIALAEGNDALAETYFSESLATCRDVGDRWGVVLCLEGFVTVAVRARRGEYALNLAGAAAAMRESAQLTATARQTGWLAEDLTVARRLVSKARFAAAWERGRALSSEDAIELALGYHNSLTPVQLTSREQEVVHLVARGWTNRQIAEGLVIDQRTAEGHVSRILARLGLQRRTQIATWAVRHGLALTVSPEVLPERTQFT
jgi:non-specific serine/threonine protein kinase